MIEVHLHTVLQLQSPRGRVSRLEVAWTQGLDLAGLAAHLGIKLDAENTLLVVNGKIQEPDYPLQDGDVVHLIPALSGG